MWTSRSYRLMIRSGGRGGDGFLGTFDITFNIFPARSLVATGVDLCFLFYMLLGVYRLVVMLFVLWCHVSGCNCFYVHLIAWFLFCFFIGQLLMGVHFYRLHNDQSKLLDTLCYHLAISHSFFIRELTSDCSSELFERLQSIRLKNESHRITSFSNKKLLYSLKPANSNLGNSNPTNKPKWI